MEDPEESDAKCLYLPSLPPTNPPSPPQPPETPHFLHFLPAPGVRCFTLSRFSKRIKILEDIFFKFMGILVGGKRGEKLQNVLCVSGTTTCVDHCLGHKFFNRKKDHFSHLQQGNRRIFGTNRHPTRLPYLTYIISVL